MQQFLATLGYGFLALVGVASLVALWEHLHRVAHAKNARLPPEAPPRAVHVDVDLATLDSAAPAGDAQHRQAAVSGAMTRMANRPAGAAWTETRPMIAPGTASEAQPH